MWSACLTPSPDSTDNETKLSYYKVCGGGKSTARPQTGTAEQPVTAVLEGFHWIQGRQLAAMQQQWTVLCAEAPLPAGPAGWAVAAVCGSTISTAEMDPVHNAPTIQLTSLSP